MPHGHRAGIVPGAPRSLYPNMPGVADSGDEGSLDRQWQERIFFELQRSLQGLSQFYVDRTNRVDEYRPESLSGESLTTTSLQPDYECDEVIESIIINGPSAASGVEVTNIGTVATPAANAIITSVILPAVGLYAINWQIEVSGANATAVNNYKLVQNIVTNVANAEQPLAIGVYPQQTQYFFNTTPGTSISILAIGAEATATITGQITAVPYQGGVAYTLQLGKRAWQMNLPPSGIQVIAPVAVKLSRSDVRQLIASLPGDWSFELMGYAETGRRGIV